MKTKNAIVVDPTVKALQKLKVILDDIEDFGNKSKYVRKYDLTPAQIHTLQDCYRNIRNGYGMYFLTQSIIPLLKWCGFDVEDHGIGYLIVI